MFCAAGTSEMRLLGHCQAGWDGGLLRRACRRRCASRRSGSMSGMPAGELGHADSRGQTGGLLLHRLRRGGRFFEQGGIVLGDLIHMGNRFVDLLDAGCLFLGR